MDTQYIQNLRYKLQKRVRRVNGAKFEAHKTILGHFWLWLDEQPLLNGILQELLARAPEGKQIAERVVGGGKSELGTTELDSASLGYWTIRHCLESKDPRSPVTIGFKYDRSGKGAEAVATFNELFVEPLYDYLDEQLDDRGAILALLRRYKHKAEWFRRQYLYDLWQKDTSRGEKHLALDLYEYLHEQGVELYIEPWSISGAADMISAQQGEERLLADAKIFDPSSSKGKSYIAKGFNQIYTYAVTYNEPVGYLVIFKVVPEDVKFAVADKSQTIPFVVHNCKTIFLVTIDICPHEHSASKRGQLKVHEITESDLISPIAEASTRTDEAVVPVTESNNAANPDPGQSSSDNNP